MPLFEVVENVDQHEKMARDILNATNGLMDSIVDYYRYGRKILWAKEGFTTADAQTVLDKMGVNAKTLFVLNENFGKFIEDNYPGALTKEELAPPIPYEVVADSVVLDPTVKYPTEK